VTEVSTNPEPNSSQAVSLTKGVWKAEVLTSIPCKRKVKKSSGEEKLKEKRNDRRK
jgi:hypothetical protein